MKSSLLLLTAACALLAAVPFTVSAQQTGKGSDQL